MKYEKLVCIFTTVKSCMANASKEVKDTLKHPWEGENNNI